VKALSLISRLLSLRFIRGPRRVFPLFLLPAAALVLLPAGCGKKADLSRLTIIHTNDLHGHILPEKVPGWRNRAGGYAVFAAWLKAQREENEKENVPLLLVDAGDIYAGTPEGNLTKGAAIVELMNAVRYDALTTGNHEYDEGFYNLTRLAKQAEFPFLAANVSMKSSGHLPPFARPFIIKDYQGLKIGIVGVVTDETPELTLASSTDRLLFRPPAPVVEFYRNLMEVEGIDLLMVLSHLGLDEDRKLAEEVPGIGLIIGGHSHDLLPRPLRVKKTGTLICQAGCYGKYAGRLDLWIDRERDKIVKYKYSIFTNREGSYPPDLETDRRMEKIEDRVGKKYRETVGMTLSDIPSPKNRESNLGDMITDAIREKTGTELAFQNPFGIRASLLTGKITLRNVFQTMPFEDKIVTMKLTGAELERLLEQSFTLRKGMLQVSGLRAEFNPRLPERHRLLSLRIGDDPVEPEKLYSVSAPGFLAEGGDYFSTFTRGREVRDTGIRVREALLDYIRKNTPLYRENFKPDRLVPTRRRK
jgi:2',3'-cyclic-nucleotide 2'-phosphodiesterase (5'-nucleotidase family)